MPVPNQAVYDDGPLLAAAAPSTASNLRRVNQQFKKREYHVELELDEIICVAEAVGEVVAHCDDVRELQRTLPTADYLKSLLREAGGSLCELNRAAELRLRTMRKIGTELTLLNLRGGDRKSNSHDASLKLSDLHLKKDFASRCRRLASLPNETFERAINEADINECELTASLLYRVAAQVKKAAKEQDATGDSAGQPSRSAQLNCGKDFCPPPVAGETDSVTDEHVPDGWCLVQRDDLDELQGNINVLCRILGNELLDWIKAESQYDNQSAVGAKTIPRYLRQLRDSFWNLLAGASGCNRGQN